MAEAVSDGERRTTLVLDAIRHALEETPWWVYVLFVYLIKSGIAARRPAVHHFARLAIVPVVFAAWGLYDLFQRFHPDSGVVAAWALSLLVGGGIGNSLLHRITISADHQRWLIGRPGDPNFLPLVVAIFIIKYAYAFALGVHPRLADSPLFAMSDVAASGLATGIFVGRLVTYWLKFRAAPSEPLQPVALLGTASDL